MKKNLLLLCFLAMTLIAKAVDFEYDGVTYTILSEADKTVSTKAGGYYSPPKEHEGLTGELKLHKEVPYNGDTYTLTEIGSYSFYNCSEITGTLTIPETVTTIGQAAFSSCSGFTGTLTIPESVTTIGSEAFRYCSGFNRTLTIPESVTTIGASAFNGCSGFTGSLTIPEFVTTIGASAFSGCTGFNGTLTIGNSVTTIGGSAFSGCSGFNGTLTIPEAVTTIGNEAFRDCSGFTGTLTIPESVITIGGGAFYGCSGFTGTLTIPESVTTIGPSAFSRCSGLTGLELGKSLTSIGESNGWVFSGCSKIETVISHAVNPPVFYGTNNFETSVLNNATLYVPAESRGLYQEANVWKDFVHVEDASEPIEAVRETFFITLDETVDLNPYLAHIPLDECTLIVQHTETVKVEDNVLEPLQYGQTTVTYRMYGADIATFDIYVWPSVTLQYGDGVIYTHHVLPNTRPTFTLAAANGCKLAGVTHDGEDISDIVSANEGKYVPAEPITGNSVINLALEELENGPTTGADAVLNDPNIRILVNGHTVNIVGVDNNTVVRMYNIAGAKLFDHVNYPNIEVIDAGVYIVEIVGQPNTYKIVVR